MKFRERHEELVREINARFTELRAMKNEFIFISQEDIEDEEFSDDYFDIRNDQTGGVFEAFIVKINKDGIHIIESDNTNKRQTIGLNDLSEVRDMISLIELMEEQFQSHSARATEL